MLWSLLLSPELHSNVLFTQRRSPNVTDATWSQDARETDEKREVLKWAGGARKVPDARFQGLERRRPATVHTVECCVRYGGTSACDGASLN